MIISEKKVVFGLFYWVIGFCGLFLTVASISPNTREVSADHVPDAPTVVKDYDPSIVRRMGLISAATYMIDQPGGVAKSTNYGAIGFKDQPTTIVRDQINAALIGTTRREIVVAFRGTLMDTLTFDELIESLYDWINDADVKLVSDKSISPGLVHQGFRDAFKSLWDDVLSDVRKRREHSNLPVIVTGHSKGGALARLAALSLLKAKIPVAGVYTFGAPRTGDVAFADDYNRRIKTDFRFENTDDVVPHTPPTEKDAADLLNQRRPDLRVRVHDSYQHVGILQFFDWEGKLQQASPALDAQRTERLHSGAYSFQIEKFADDHSLTNAYEPRLTKLVRR